MGGGLVGVCLVLLGRRRRLTYQNIISLPNCSCLSYADNL